MRANLENSVSLEDAAAGSLIEWICPMTLAGLPVGERRDALRDAAQVVPTQLGNPPDGAGHPGGPGSRRKTIGVRLPQRIPQDHPQ